ncbi:MAG TPA: tripartite tricarboxylate transporter permease, partial [Bacillota bacterium]|nr:tripartite tricarboxylate transporter permease [Bacillota bacterium]
DIPYLLILKDMWQQKWNVIRSSLIGVFVGILPGAGGDVSNFVSYDQARKGSKEPEKFGTGIPAGIVASESSNNATAGGSLIPTLTLGIPGDMAMAIMMGVLILHGITPGPMLFQNDSVLVGGIYVSLIIAAIVMLSSMLFLIRIFSKIASIPVSSLVPIVIMLCVVGSFTLNRNIFDIWSLFVFGIIGYLLVKAEVPISPLVLGVILGQNFEHNLFRSLELNSSLLTFLTRPISLIIIIITVLSVIYSLYQDIKLKKSENKIAS